MKRQVKSARRALEILELYERLRRPAAVNEMAALLGYPQSSTSMLVNSLKDLGYLSYNPADRTFAPSMRIALIGEWIRLGEVGRADLLELMNRLQRETGGTVILSTRQMASVQYIHIIAPDSGVGPRGRPGRVRLVVAGALRPIHRVAAGLMLLSDCGNAEISKLVRSINAQSSEPPESLSRLQREIDRARERGYACITGGVLPTTGSIAVRLPYDDMFGKPLALSVSGPAPWIKANEENFARLMRMAVMRYVPADAAESDDDAAARKPASRERGPRATPRVEGNRPARVKRPPGGRPVSPVVAGRAKARR